MNENQPLAGQIAAVTGGAQGIGRAIADRLAADGAKVWLLDFDGDAAARAAGELGDLGAAQATDVTDEASLIAARDAILATDGRIDILVNNAGVYPQGTTRELTVADWDRVFDINCKGVFLASRVFMDPMITAGYGHMVSIVTVDAYVAKPSMPHYAASKAAVLSLVRTFAQELAPHGIMVNGVSPGAIATERAKSEGWLAKHIPNIPVGRAGEPSDIAEVVAFLASPVNRFVTGETVIASGGMVMV
ncbi:MAG: SDR family NAD(P)-dependent oxidoreductase [Acidimicrobiales bacterium]|jgi:3-oxoacyl-[acyl-carrier protein] reductase